MLTAAQGAHKPHVQPQGMGQFSGVHPHQGTQLSPKQKRRSDTCNHTMSLEHSVQCEKPGVEVLGPVCETPRTGTSREEADRLGAGVGRSDG